MLIRKCLSHSIDLGSRFHLWYKRCYCIVRVPTVDWDINVFWIKTQTLCNNGTCSHCRSWTQTHHFGCAVIVISDIGDNRNHTVDWVCCYNQKSIRAIFCAQPSKLHNTGDITSKQFLLHNVCIWSWYTDSKYYNFTILQIKCVIC